jgi:hypothetical protein
MKVFCGTMKILKVWHFEIAFLSKIIYFGFVMVTKMSAIRLVIALALATVGCASLLFGKGAMPLFIICIGFINFAFWDRTVFSRPIPKREFWVMTFFFLAFVLLIIAANFWLPKSGAADFDFISRPAFVVSLWILLLCGLWRRWQKQKTSSQ